MKEIKKQIAGLLYNLILFFVRLLPAKKGVNGLLLIKTDEIGDYVLFRNYLQYFKQSLKYKNYRITLVGNKSWEQIFNTYDKDTVDEVIWLDKKQFKTNLVYRFKFLKGIRDKHFSDVINCIFSRSIDPDDGIAWVAAASYKAAMSSDDTNRKKNEANHDKEIYTEIVEAGNRTLFDAIRNKNFISTILDIKTIKADTRINTISSNKLPDKYFIVFLGAGNPERKWPLNFFLEITNYIYSMYGLMPIICGGKDDMTEADEFVNSYNKKIKNYVGKTTLIELIELLSNAEFLICVDTGTLHIAAAVNCPVIGLYSGKFYGRFAPYPKEISKYFYAVYPDFVDSLIANGDPILYETSVMKNNTIRLIQPDKVVPLIRKILE